MSTAQKYPPEEDRLAAVIAQGEDWLMQRVLDHAKQFGYARYTSTLLEAWRVSIRGLSAALVEALAAQQGMPPVCEAPASKNDAGTRFGIACARAHRARGVTLQQFLGLMKYYRQAYLELLESRAQPDAEQTALVHRFFDRVEVALCGEWGDRTGGDLVAELQDRNRELTNEKNRYLTLLESLQDAVFFVSRELVIEGINHAAAALLDPTVVPGAAHYGDRFLGTPFPWVREPLAEFCAGAGNSVSLEVRIATGEGPRDLAVRARKMLDASDKFRGLTVLCEDITERKILETVQHQNERKYRYLLESTRTVPWELDLASGRFTYMGPRIEDLLGYPRESWVDMNSWAERLHPDDRDWAVSYCADYTRQGRDHDFVYRTVAADGRVLWLHDVVAVVALDGEPQKLVGFLHDVTAQKEAEQALRDSELRFRRLFNHAPLPYQSLDEEGRLVAVNDTWLRVLGYRREEVLGRPFAEFLAPEHRPHFAESFPRFKARGEVQDVEHVMLHKAGTQVIGAFTASLVRDRDGRFLQTHCLFQDITAERALEQERRQLEERLRHSQKMAAIGTLAGGIAHDFNNILSAIVGYSELTLLDVDDARENTTAVLEAALRAKDLVRQILTFSQKTDGQRTAVALPPLVEEAARLLRATVPKTVEIRTDIPPDCPAVVADPAQLHQVIMNLGANAYHAMRPAGGRLHIALETAALETPTLTDTAQLPPGRYVQLVVADTGSGMDPVVKARIFEPFFTTKDVGDGTGMGLSVVHGIVEGLRGGIQVDSQPGEGTQFSVLLPAATAAAVAAQARAELQDTPAFQGRVLLVDDEASLVEVGRRMLQAVGFEVAAFSDSRKALDAFLEQPDGFDLVITDQTMPGITGAALTAEIRSVRRHLPVILSTGHSDTLDAAAARELGANAFLRKPLTRGELLEAVATALDGNARAPSGEGT